MDRSRDWYLRIPGATVIFSQLLWVAIFLVAIVWSIRYGRHAMQRAAAQLG